jgi:hypothetical protein
MIEHPTIQPSVPGRHWFWFSLRWLFVLTTIASLAALLYRERSERIRRYNELGHASTYFDEMTVDSAIKLLIVGEEDEFILRQQSENGRWFVYTLRRTEIPNPTGLIKGNATQIK